MVMKLPKGGTAPVPSCDTSGMGVIHGVLRRRFSVLPELVRGVNAGDRERAAVVARHASEFIEMLHTHHETEDTHLWDLLESRSPACAVHVEQMKSQHRVVAGLIIRLGLLLPEWRRAAEPELRDQIAETLDEVNTALGVHLGEEEARILPVAAVTMSQREWDAFADLGRKSVPKDRLLVQLGYVLDTLAPDQRAVWERANLPAPVRGLYGAFGHRQFTRDYRRVFGADPT